MNQILVILDSLRKDHVGAYGNSWIHTPNLDTFARDAVVFDQAFPESLPTLPVRRALATGVRTFPFRHYVRHRGDHVAVFGWQPIPEEQVTLAEILQRRGINTTFITDTYHQFKPSMNFHRGFNQFLWIRGQETDCYKTGGDVDDIIEPHLFSKTEYTMRQVAFLERYFRNVKHRQSEADYFAPRVFSEGITWLEENYKHPFFLVVDSFDPHEPWDPPEYYRTLYPPARNYTGAKIITSLYGSTDPYTPEEMQYMQACYAGEVSMVDTWFGRFLGKLDALGLRDSTMVTVISDHGHQLGQHNITGKVPWGLYPELVDLVLMVRGPQFPPHRVSNLVYNLDVTPTILAQQGASATAPTMDGQDLTPLLINNPGWLTRKHITVGFALFILARTEQHAYITDAAHG